eukprot:gene20006-26720_t
MGWDILGSIDDVVDVIYDTDKGSKVTLARKIELSPVRYAIQVSKIQGQVSPVRYAIMRSKSPRFRDKVEEGVPVGTYTLDTLNKKSMVTSVQDSQIRYAAPFKNQRPRFNRPWTSYCQETFYDPPTTQNCNPNTVSRSVELSSYRYSILKSRDPRVLKTTIPVANGCDRQYNIDHGTKTTLATAVEKSPIRYRNISTKSAKWQKPKLDFYPHLGPGSYDTVPSREIHTPVSEEQRPLSSMASTSRRFSTPKPIEGRPVDMRYRPKTVDDSKSTQRKAMNEEHIESVKLKAQSSKLKDSKAQIQQSSKTAKLKAQRQQSSKTAKLKDSKAQRQQSSKLKAQRQQS